MDIGKINLERLSHIHPKIAERAVAFLQRCPVPVLITQGLRTFAEQNALYAQGRTTKGQKVTNARGGQSYHNYGLAIDFVPIDAVGKLDWNPKHPAWETVIKCAESVGFESGARWKKFVDIPHLQITGGLTIEQCKLLYSNGGINAVWNELSKRV